jgi:hypothetical protein
MRDERLSTSTPSPISAHPGLGDAFAWWLVLVFLLPYVLLLAILSAFVGVQRVLSRKWPLPEPDGGRRPISRAG